MAVRVFEDAVLPHLDAAYNYARWLTKNHAEAEDVVQDACVRAMRFLSSLRDDDARGWLFAIVRNTWYSRVSRRSNRKVKSLPQRESDSSHAITGLPAADARDGRTLKLSPRVMRSTGPVPSRAYT